MERLQPGLLASEMLLFQVTGTSHLHPGYTPRRGWFQVHSHDAGDLRLSDYQGRHHLLLE